MVVVATDAPLDARQLRRLAARTPMGLARVGGFAGLHAAVPDFMFNLFGSAATSEYAWYTILAMVLSNLVSIIAVSTGMQTAGSAKNETAARVGMIGGMDQFNVLTSGTPAQIAQEVQALFDGFGRVWRPTKFTPSTTMRWFSGWTLSARPADAASAASPNACERT